MAKHNFTITVTIRNEDRNRDLKKENLTRRIFIHFLCFWKRNKRNIIYVYEVALHGVSVLPSTLNGTIDVSRSKDTSPLLAIIIVMVCHSFRGGIYIEWE